MSPAGGDAVVNRVERGGSQRRKEFLRITLRSGWPLQRCPIRKRERASIIVLHLRVDHRRYVRLSLLLILSVVLLLLKLIQLPLEIHLLHLNCLKLSLSLT